METAEHSIARVAGSLSGYGAKNKNRRGYSLDMERRGGNAKVTELEFDTRPGRTREESRLRWRVFRPVVVQALASRRSGASRASCNTSPTLLVQSRTDPRVASAVAESALAAIGAEEKKLVWIEGAGHIISRWITAGQESSMRYVRGS